jgi:hypothetical protein
VCVCVCVCVCVYSMSRQLLIGGDKSLENAPHDVTEVSAVEVLMSAG